MPQFDYINQNGLNYISVSNVLNNDEMDLFWNTFHYFKPFFNGGLATGSATDKKGRPLKTNTGFFLTEAQPMPQIYDVFNGIVFNNLVQMMEHNKFPSDSIFATSRVLNWDTHLLQYYDDDKQGYKSHNDHSTFSAVFFFYKEPKNFTGGDFYFEDYDVTYSIVNNTGIIFPSAVRHGVTPISIIDKNVKTGGRASYSVFTGIN